MVSQSLLRSVSRRFANHRRSTSLLNNHLSSQQLFKSTAAIETEHESETFLTGSTSLYAEQMYENWTNDPNSVHETWRKYFEDVESGRKYDQNSFNRPTVVISNQKKVGEARDSHLAVSLKKIRIFVSSC